MMFPETKPEFIQIGEALKVKIIDFVLYNPDSLEPFDNKIIIISDTMLNVCSEDNFVQFLAYKNSKPDFRIEVQVFNGGLLTQDMEQINFIDWVKKNKAEWYQKYRLLID